MKDTDKYIKSSCAAVGLIPFNPKKLQKEIDARFDCVEDTTIPNSKPKAWSETVWPCGGVITKLSTVGFINNTVDWPTWLEANAMEGCSIVSADENSDWDYDSTIDWSK
eukprot:323938_1